MFNNIDDENNGSNMINEVYKYSELTSKILGYAMKVHSTLGNGFRELIYQRAKETKCQNNDFRLIFMVI